MLDGFLKFGAGFDWITPLWAFFQDARYGQPFQINVPYNVGWSSEGLVTELKEKGIRTWGFMVVGDNLTFTVRKPQARYTLYWLQRWGVPYQARVDKLPAISKAKAAEDDFEENFEGDYEDDFESEDEDDFDDTPEDYYDTVDDFAEGEDGVEDDKQYASGLVEFSIRKINIAADRFVGRR